MVYRPHTLVAFGGSLNINNEKEVWECTIRGFAGTWSNTDALPLTDGQPYCDEVAPHLASWFTQASSGIPGFVSLDYLKCNAIGADGKYSGTGSTNVHDFTGTTGGATQAAPSFCSLAYSWQTTRTRPPAAFGRMYPPNFSYAAQGGEVLPASRSAALLAAGLLINVIANQGSSAHAFHPAVVSNKGAAYAFLTAARVGSVYDTQRRRKNNLTEVYSSEPVPVS